jgi:hypothetical protein
VVLESTEAEIVALERYIATAKEVPGNVAEIKKQLAEEKAKVQAMRKELETLRDDARVGRDAAGASADSEEEKRLRSELRRVHDDEARFIAGLTGKLGGKARAKANQILRLLQTASAITEESDRVLDKIDAVADAALVDVRRTIAEEKARLASYTQEFKNYEGESHVLGGEVLGSAFGVVAGKFRDVLMRSDVGIVDVSWSHKESNERLRRRLVLDRARERKTLDSDFRDVIEELREEEERAQGGEK